MTDTAEVDATLDRAFPIPEAPSPGEVVRLLAKIEDDLAKLQDKARDTGPDLKKSRVFIDTYEATLAQVADGDNVTAKKLAGQAQLHNTAYYRKYLVTVEEHEKIESDFKYLDVRRSILQSILKSFERDEARFGQGRGQG